MLGKALYCGAFACCRVEGEQSVPRAEPISAMAVEEDAAAVLRCAEAAGGVSVGVGMIESLVVDYRKYAPTGDTAIDATPSHSLWPSQLRFHEWNMFFDVLLR